MSEQQNLPDIGKPVRKIYIATQEEGQQVLTELETRSIWANEHHRGVEQSLGSALDHAIKAGEHLAAARDSFTEQQIRDGEWKRWLSENFRASQDTAQRYIRIFRNKDKLGSATSPTLSIDGALKALATPKQEKPDTQAPIIEVEPVSESSNLVEFEKRLAQLEAEKAEAEAARKKEVKERKEAQQAARDTQRLLEQGNKELQEEMKGNLQAQLAEVYARYEIEETPKIFEVNEKHWQTALKNTKDRREQEILSILSDFFPSVIKMRKYEPTEAARACLNWPSEARAKEAIEDIAQWMSEVSEEMQILTQKGVLRAVASNERSK